MEIVEILAHKFKQISQASSFSHISQGFYGILVVTGECAMPFKSFV